MNDMNENNTEKRGVSVKGKPAENRMGTEPIHGLLIRMSVPLMISMFVQAMYNIVDSYFVARVSEDAFTAVSMCFPVQSLMIAFGIGTALGMSALMSRFLGAGDFERVNTIAKNGLFLSWCIYAVFLVIGFFSYRFIAGQTADSNIIRYGGDYLSVICCLSLPLFMQLFCERLLQATGKTKYIFCVQMSAAVINCLLDPIFIFGLLGAPRLEAKGAAVATVIAQGCGAGIALYLNIAKNKEISINMAGFRPSIPDIKAIYKIGLPTIIMQSVGSLMVFGYNQLLFTFSKTAVAVFGALFKLMSFVFMPVFGMNNGVVPLVAYNYGAKKRSRMEAVIKLSARYAVLFMAAGTVLFWSVPEQLLKVFSASGEMTRIGVICLRTISIGFPCAGYAIMRGSVFQALGKSVYSMNISIVRQLLVLLPAAYLLSKAGDLNLVWLSFPIAELVGLAMSVMYSRRVVRDIIEEI